ncbi:MAG: GtrA family protein [Clostridiales bacterium]|jgi:putative flippase GtrA|nr:GtrA family protein [Clostridiales bacterium]
MDKKPDKSIDEKANKLRIINIIKKFINRETIAYGIAGVMTTLVNFISYETFFRLGLSNLNANALAWVIAVSFAYIVNKINVFKAKSKDIKDEISKLVKFFGARLVTLGVEQVGMYLFIERLGYHRLLVKAALTGFVIVLNYIFSKLFIFNKKD